MNEKLEKLNRQKTAAEKKLIAAQHREKQLEHERKRLTRSERTHRLCTRAGMLEKFLREPKESREPHESDYRHPERRCRLSAA